MATIHFAAGLDQSMFSDHSMLVLAHLLDLSGNPSCLITCLGRSPRAQAVVMHNNCIANGTDEQMKTYLPPGQAVIRVFIADIHKNAADTIADMEAEILRQGPSRVSRHCGDQSVNQVFDVAQSSLRNADALHEVAGGHTHVADVAQCLDENGCLHFVLPQPPTVAVA